MNKQFRRFRIKKLKKNIKGNIGLQVFDSYSSCIGNREEKTEYVQQSVNNEEEIDCRLSQLQKQMVGSVRKDKGKISVSQGEDEEIEHYELPAIEKREKEQYNIMEEETAKKQTSFKEIDQQLGSDKEHVHEVKSNLTEPLLMFKNQVKNQPNIDIISQKGLLKQQPQKELQLSIEQEQEQLFVQRFSPIFKSLTIDLDQSVSIATQRGNYWENKKIILSQIISAPKATAIFNIKNLKYCVGMGVALKEVIQKHQYTYISHQNELSHGLYLITSQGYSWSHSHKSEDDVFRPSFNKMKNGDHIEIRVQNGKISFTFSNFSFQLFIPDSVRQKYSLCFCAYLHEKLDCLQLNQKQTYSK